MELKAIVIDYPSMCMPAEVYDDNARLLCYRCSQCMVEKVHEVVTLDEFVIGPL